MELEQQVVSLELAKKLKELGVEQNSVWYWFQPIVHVGLEWKGSGEYKVGLCGEFAAFTVSELGEMLPELMDTKRAGEFYHVTDIAYSVRFTEKTEADARAQALIWLIENGHYEPKLRDPKKH